MSYEAEWAAIRRDVYHHWFLFLGSCIPIPFAALFTSEFLGDTAGLIVFLCLGVHAVIQQSRLCRARCFTCPRCQQPFRTSGLYGGSGESSCQNCGLGVGETTQTQDTAKQVPGGGQ